MKEETKYNDKYVVKIVKKVKIKNIKLILYISKSCNFAPGDILKFQGKFNKSEKVRNYKGFNYSNYLRQSKIYGIIYSDNLEKISTQKDKYYFRGKILNYRNKFLNSGINKLNLCILAIGDKYEKNYYLWNYNIWIFDRNWFLLCKSLENK